MIRVAIVDDHNVFRIGVRYMLKLAPDFVFAGESGTAVGVADFVGKCRADVVLLDIRMPEVSGIEALRTLKARNPKTKVLMLTTSDTEEDVAQAIKSGADGYVLKDLPPEELVQAIRTVAEGGRCLSPQIAALYDQHQSSPELSAREREVLGYVSKGLSNAEIGRLIHLSPETVKIHVRHLFAKLDVSDRAEAVTMAIARGILKV
ncbi:MAG: response regulator [Kiritimatiellia bacterium]